MKSEVFIRLQFHFASLRMLSKRHVMTPSHKNTYMVKKRQQHKQNVTPKRKIVTETKFKL